MRGIRLDLFAKLIHEHAQILDLVAVVGSPHGLQQPAMRDGHIGIREQVLEQIEFLGREANFAGRSKSRGGWPD